MESIQNRSTVLPVSLDGTPLDSARITLRDGVLDTGSAIARFITLWHETIATFLTNAGPVLLSGWVGFAATVVVTQAIRSLTRLTPASEPWVFLAGGAAGFLLDTLAQGALASIGVQTDIWSGRLSLAEIWHKATAGWWGLLPGALVHAALTFAFALSLTPILMSRGLLSVNLEPIDPNLNGPPLLTATRLAATHSLDTAALGALNPFGEWVTPARTLLRPLILRTEQPDPEQVLAYDMKYHLDPSVHRFAQEYVVPMEVLPAGLIAVAGLALLVAGEILLRLNAAAAVSLEPLANPGLTGAFVALRKSVRLGARHAGLVLITAVMLRLFTRVIQIMCLILTASVAESTVLPQLAGTIRALWVVPVGGVACIVGSMALAALLTAFCALFDARLYVSLTRM